MNDGSECETEDEFIEDELMFEFEQDLRIHDQERGNSQRTALFQTPQASDPMPHFTSIASFEARPQNPVAALLHSASEEEDVEEDKPPVPPPRPQSSLGSPTLAAANVLVTNQFAFPRCHQSPSFDYNGRRKRKYFDDSCCVTPRVRPLAKRAKSFCSVRDALPTLPDLTFTATASSDRPSPQRGDTMTSELAPMNRRMASFSVDISRRSESIPIPENAKVRPSTFPQGASAGNRAHGLARHKSGEATVGASSDPSSAPSWNSHSPVEYLCRRSLDISSPLRLRFRDLMVGAVARGEGFDAP